VNPINISSTDNITLQLLNDQIKEINFILDEFYLFTLAIFISRKYILYI